MIMRYARSIVYYICPEKPGVSGPAAYILEGVKKRKKSLREGEGETKNRLFSEQCND